MVVVLGTCKKLGDCTFCISSKTQVGNGSGLFCRNGNPSALVRPWSVYGTTNAAYGTTNADAGMGVGMKRGNQKFDKKGY